MLKIWTFTCVGTIWLMCLESFMESLSRCFLKYSLFLSKCLVAAISKWVLCCFSSLEGNHCFCWACWAQQMQSALRLHFRSAAGSRLLCLFRPMCGCQNRTYFCTDVRRGLGNSKESPTGSVLYNLHSRHWILGTHSVMMVRHETSMQYHNQNHSYTCH